MQSARVLLTASCPSARSPSASTPKAPDVESLLTGRYTDYAYYGKGLKEDCRGFAPERTIIACDRRGNHRRFLNVLFSTGRVKGYEGTSIEEIADENGLFLPGYNMPEKAKTEEPPTPE